jgi:hypothetical protein
MIVEGHVATLRSLLPRARVTPMDVVSMRYHFHHFVFLLVRRVLHFGIAFASMFQQGTTPEDVLPVEEVGHLRRGIFSIITILVKLQFIIWAAIHLGNIYFPYHTGGIKAGP